jgi:hypothetical protein
MKKKYATVETSSSVRMVSEKSISNLARSLKKGFEMTQEYLNEKQPGIKLSDIKLTKAKSHIVEMHGHSWIRVDMNYKYLLL